MRTISRLFLPLAIAIAFPARAAYLDDRSTPDALVQSLYNALNAHEYARAWSYFETGPAASFEAYAEGFAGTERIRLLTGPAEADGTAGTTYWMVPAAIEAIDKAGKASVFAGCYTVKLVSPAEQDAPYRPMVIEKASIKPSDATVEEALPPGCGGDSTAAADAALVEKSRQLIRTALPECDEDAIAGDPEIHDLEWNYASDAQDAEKRKSRLLRFTCRTAAYNVVDVFLLSNRDEGLALVSFAEPELDIRYEDEEQTKLKSISVMGMKASALLVNASIAADEQAIYSASKWRGIGDAGSSGKWIFRDGAFTLVTYEVDPTYDEQSDFTTVIDYETAP